MFGISKQSEFGTASVNKQSVSIEKWDGLSDAGQAVRAPDHRDRRSNVDLFEKHGSEVSRHPHAPVGCGIPGKITGMHADCLAEFHVVWHWRGSITATRWYVGAGSCIRCCDPARAIDN